MKRLSMIILSLVVMAILSLNFQTTALAASFKSSPPVKRVTTMVPNCPSTVGTSKATPNCVPYPRCTATGCYNLDPYAEGCGTATTYNHISYVQTSIDEGIPGAGVVTYGYITNYYSSWCVANWAEVSVTTAGHNISIITDLQITTTDANKHNEEMCYPVKCNPFSFYTGTAYPSWTNMVDGTNMTYAHVYAEVDGTDGYRSLLPYPIDADQ